MGTFFFPRSSKNSKKTGKEGSSATEKETNLQPKSKPPTKPFYQRTVEGLGWSLRPFPPPPLSWPSLQAFKIVSHNFLISHLLTPKSQPINGAVFRSFVLCFPKKKRKTLVGLVPRVQKKAIPTTCMVYMGPTQWTNLFLFVCFFRPGQFRTPERRWFTKMAIKWRFLTQNYILGGSSQVHCAGSALESSPFIYLQLSFAPYLYYRFFRNHIV